MVYLFGYLLDLLAFGVLLFRYATVENENFDWYLGVYPSLMLIFIGIRLLIVGRQKGEVYVYAYCVKDHDKDWYLIFGYGALILAIALLIF